MNERDKEEILRIKEEREIIIENIRRATEEIEEKRKKRLKYYKDDNGQEKENLGQIYDFKDIMKEYKKLNIPKEYYEIPWKFIEEAKYFVSLSSRSTGKTTNWLLFGMIMNKMYGTQMAYVRLRKANIVASIIPTLFGNIVAFENGRYIKFLTNNAYNSIYYSRQEHKAFYQYVDEYGNVIARSPEPFCYMLAIEKSEDLKSGFNMPKGDFILLDEFISKTDYIMDEPFLFLDLFKTIARDRLSPLIVMVANTIERVSPFFNQLEISKPMKRIMLGEGKLLESTRGTKIYAEVFEDKKPKKQKKKQNTLFFAFSDPRMSSITGEGDTFAYNRVQPFLKLKDKILLDYKHYILIEGELLRLDVYYDEKFGNFLEVHRANDTYNDSVICVCEDIIDSRFVYGFGYNSPFEKLMLKLIRKNKIYFQDNECGYYFNLLCKSFGYR